MKNPLKRKRCKQCGEPLRLFDKTDCCDINCYTMYKSIEKEYEESKKKYGI
jgi:hypothetical protein